MSKNTSILKKAYCPKCRSNNELYPIFDVNPEADVCYCPNCMTELKPKDVIDNYNYFIAQKINKAESLLFTDTKFLEAYESFGDILKIDSSIYRARFGRILSLIYMSTLRKSTFLSANLLLKEEAEQYFHKLKDQIAYTKFLNKINYALEEYYKRFVRKITFKERFYDSDCVELYLLRVHEIIELKKTVLEEAEVLYSKFDEPRVRLLIATLNVSLIDLNEKYNSELVSIDGEQHKVVRIVNANQALVSILSVRLPAFNHYRKRKLNDDEKKGKLISNKVYPDNSHYNLLIKIDFPLMIAFAILSAIAFAVTFINKGSIHATWLLISAIGASIITITLLVFFIIWKALLRSRRHLID